MYMYHIFINSSVGGHLDCFHATAKLKYQDGYVFVFKFKLVNTGIR